ncbi:MAG: hypothetical protein ACI4PB_00285, partial [Oscillospiraceae bacterium]
YLTAQTDNVTNTFAVAGLVDDDAGFTLVESKANQQADGKYVLNPADKVQANDYVVVPGVDLPKDPTINLKLKANIDAYVFLAVDNNLKGMSVTIDPAWSAITTYTDEDGVAWDIYAQKVVGTTAAQDLTFNVLKDQIVTVDKAADDYDGNILFNAYLTQATGFDTALAAWNATFGVKAA